MQYRIARIPKGGGKYREIYIASKSDNLRLRALIPKLENILLNLDIYGVNYAFQKRKSCTLNALQHIGYRYTLSMDLEDFFNSISQDHVNFVIPDSIIQQCFLNGSPKQGLPTSPIISTIAFLSCDKEIIESLDSLKIRYIYTRYADDLTFSFDRLSDAAIIKSVARQIIEKRGLKINERKTNLQDSKNGKVIITGIAVDKNGICATRRTKKKARAAIHQKNLSSLRGLIEWSKCKLPNNL